MFTFIYDGTADNPPGGNDPADPNRQGPSDDMTNNTGGGCRNYLRSVFSGVLLVLIIAVMSAWLRR